MGVVKEGPNPQMCAVITLHRWLPGKGNQVASARSWGIPELMYREDDVSALWIDDVRKVERTTNWPGQLPERANLIKGLRQVKGRGDKVFFVNPLAVGFSAKHAQAVVEKVFDLGHMIYVHDMGALYREGDDLADFYGEHGRQLKAAQQRDFRAAQKSRK